MKTKGGFFLLASLALGLVLGGAPRALADGGGDRPGPGRQSPVEPGKIPTPAGKVRGPWADARVGTAVKIKETEPQILRDIIRLTFFEVIAADELTVTVKAGGTVNDKKMNDQTRAFPRFFTPAELQSLMEGWGRKIDRKTSSCGGQDVLCDIYEKKETRSSDSATATRMTYISEQVPTWIVRVIDTARDRDGGVHSYVPHEILSFTWGPAGEQAPASKPAPPAKKDERPRPAPELKSGRTEFPDVPKNEENRALAAGVMARFGKESYTILDTDVTGFDARFAVLKNGAPAGSVRAIWSSEAGQTVSKFQGPLDADEADWLQNLTTMGLLQSLFTEGDQPQLYAQRSDDGGYILSDYSAVNDAVASRQALISEDRTQTGEILKLKSGDVRRIVRQARPDGNRLLVKSAGILIQSPDGTRRSADFTFEIAVKSGVPFVGRMTIVDIGTDGVKTVWRLDLDHLNLTRPAKNAAGGPF